MVSIGCFFFEKSKNMYPVTTLQKTLTCQTPIKINHSFKNASMTVLKMQFVNEINFRITKCFCSTWLFVCCYIHNATVT